MFLPQENKTFATLYIGGLEKQISESQIYNVFIQYGPIYSLRLMKNFQTKESRGFAFVSFYNQVDAQNAKQKTNHMKIIQQSIRVTWKKNPSEFSSNDNIFIKNIPQNYTEQEQTFQKYGSVFSLKISCDDNGISRGYGYVQFENSEGTQNCLKDQNILLNGQKCEVQSFSTRQSRGENQENNLYMKNFPFMSISELENKLQQVASKYGETTSILAKKDSQNRLFAFVCFKNSQDAKVACEKMNNLDIFNCGVGIYVNFCMKKSQRQAMIEKEFDSKNETNIFTKNLKESVNKQMLEQIFQQFGETTSVAVNTPQNSNITTKYGFINFKNKESAMNCLMNAQQNKEVKNLYKDEAVYANFLLNKKKYESFQINRKIQKKNYLKAQQTPMVDQNQLAMLQQMFAQFQANFMKGGQMPMTNMMPMANMMPMMQGFQKKQQNFPNRNVVQQKPEDIQKKFNNIEYFNANQDQFNQFDKEVQRKILGELLYPKIKEKISDKEMTARITGMLIDLEVFEIQDIIEILKNQTQLTERINEAVELIQESDV